MPLKMPKIEKGKVRTMPHQAQPDKHSAYFDLLDACKKGGCPICTMALDTVDRYLDATIYENVNDGELRTSVIRAHGFCNDHSWRLRELRAGFGVALMYRDVLRHVGEEIARQPADGKLDLFGSEQGHGGLLDRLTALGGGGEPGKGEQDVADPHRACPACLERERYELLYLGALAAHAGEDEVAQAVRQTGGLCLVHLDQAALATRDTAALGRLLDLQHACIEALYGELSEFIRKHDYRFRGEGMGAEGNSWIRATEMVAGKPGIR